MYHTFPKSLLFHLVQLNEKTACCVAKVMSLCYLYSHIQFLACENETEPTNERTNINQNAILFAKQLVKAFINRKPSPQQLHYSIINIFVKPNNICVLGLFFFSIYQYIIYEAISCSENFTQPWRCAYFHILLAIRSHMLNRLHQDSKHPFYNWKILFTKFNFPTSKIQHGSNQKVKLSLILVTFFISISFDRISLLQ